MRTSPRACAGVRASVYGGRLRAHLECRRQPVPDFLAVGVRRRRRCARRLELACRLGRTSARTGPWPQPAGRPGTFASPRSYTGSVTNLPGPSSGGP